MPTFFDRGYGYLKVLSVKMVLSAPQHDLARRHPQVLKVIDFQRIVICRFQEKVLG